MPYLNDPSNPLDYLKHILPFFRLRGKLGPNAYKLRGRLAEVQHKGSPLLSMLPWLAGAGAVGLAGQSQQQQ